MEVVPAEVLADTVDRRHVDRDLRALQLDGFLRRLARQEAVCRRVLGRLARTFLAGRYHHRLRFSVRCPRRVRARWRQAVELARRMAGSELTLAQAAEVIAAEGLSAAPAPVDDRMPPEPLPEPVETPPDLGWSRVDVPIPEDVEKLLQLGPGGDPFTVDERLRTARRAMQHIDWQMGVLLRTFFDLRLHRAFGFPSASRHVP